MLKISYQKNKVHYHNEWICFSEKMPKEGDVCWVWILETHGGSVLMEEYQEGMLVNIKDTDKFYGLQEDGSIDKNIVEKNADGRWTANIIKLTWVRNCNCSNLPEIIKGSVCLYGLEIRMLKSSFRIHISSVNRDFWRGGKCRIF